MIAPARHPFSRRDFLAAATAATTFSAASLFRLERLAAADVAEPKIDDLVSKAVEYLTKHQSPDGAFTPQAGVGITALVVTGLLQKWPLAG